MGFEKRRSLKGKKSVRQESLHFVLTAEDNEQTSVQNFRSIVVDLPTGEFISLEKNNWTTPVNNQCCAGVLIFKLIMADKIKNGDNIQIHAKVCM